MSNVRKTIVTNCEKKFVIKNLSEWKRLDGRSFQEFRDLTISFGKDWGCCYVSLGKTRVVAQVSCEIQQPKSSRPSEGILYINIELNPLSAPHFEAGRQSDLSVQLNRLLEKCLKDSKAVDLESLCIKMNEKVWALRVDVNVLNHEGNILDCASVAALAALAHFRRPDISCDGEEFIIHSYKQKDPLPTVIHHYPVCVTYSIFSGGDYIVADPTLVEEGVADAFLTIGLNAYKELCGLHLGGKAELTPEVILNTTNQAAARAITVVKQIKEAIEADTKQRENGESVGFASNIKSTKEDTTNDLITCLDQWHMKSRKNKKKVKKSPGKNKGDENKMEIESLGKGSAALVPEENGQKVWSVSSEEEDADDSVMIVETPKSKVSVVQVDSDSEEDAVVVLNADMKTNKNKRKMKK